MSDGGEARGQRPTSDADWRPGSEEQVRSCIADLARLVEDPLILEQAISIAGVRGRGPDEALGLITHAFDVLATRVRGAYEGTAQGFRGWTPAPHFVATMRHGQAHARGGSSVVSVADLRQERNRSGRLAKAGHRSDADIVDVDVPDPAGEEDVIVFVRDLREPLQRLARAPRPDACALGVVFAQVELAAAGLIGYGEERHEHRVLLARSFPKQLEGLPTRFDDERRIASNAVDQRVRACRNRVRAVQRQLADEFRLSDPDGSA